MEAVERGATRLVRLGFADASRAADLLGDLRLWAGAAPADDGAAAVVSALGRAADPDLAVHRVPGGDEVQGVP